MRSPSNTANEYLVPPISTASVRMEHLPRRRRPGALLHDRDRGDQISEARRFDRRGGHGQGPPRAGSKAVARPPDVDRLPHAARRRPFPPPLPNDPPPRAP